MFENINAVYAWAVTRKLVEIQRKLEFWGGRRNSFIERSLPDGMRTAHFMQANRSMAITASEEIDRYMRQERTAKEISEMLYRLIGDMPQLRLDIEVLSYAVYRGGIQRAWTYQNALGWSYDRLHEVVNAANGAFCLYEVLANGDMHLILSGENLTAQQQRLFAVHGGLKFDFSYSSVYRQIEQEWIGRVQ